MLIVTNLGSGLMVTPALRLPQGVVDDKLRHLQGVSSLR